MRIEDSIAAFQKFCGPNLTQTLSEIEWSIRGVSTERLDEALEKFGASGDTFAAAGQLKDVVGQLNVVIHALGILLCLPHVMEPGEIIDYVSLGAGNTGRSFDLETDRRVAEFKFIRWQGGAEAIRQNSLFKDFYLMAEHQTLKKRCLYVLGTHYPLKFLNAGRAIKSVLSRHVKLMEEFTAKHGDQYPTVRDYYQPRKAQVSIEDVSPWLVGLPVADDEAEATL